MSGYGPGCVKRRRRSIAIEQVIRSTPLWASTPQAHSSLRSNLRTSFSSRFEFLSFHTVWAHSCPGRVRPQLAKTDGAFQTHPHVNRLNACRIAPLDQRTALADQCLHSVEADASQATQGASPGLMLWRAPPQLCPEKTGVFAIMLQRSPARSRRSPGRALQGWGRVGDSPQPSKRTSGRFYGVAGHRLAGSLLRRTGNTTEWRE